MKGVRAAAAAPVFLAALAVIVIGIGIVVAAPLLAKVLGVLAIVGGFWLLRATEALTGAPRQD